MNLVENLAHAQTLAQAIVNTIPEPFLVLDEQLRVVVASRSFYATFHVDPEQTRGQLLYALGNGQWDIPALRLLLETIIPDRTSMDGFEVAHDFPGVGPRIMLLNARKVIYDDSSKATILLAFSDVTARRAVEREKAELQNRTEELLHQKQVLLREMQHRIANSLQIIASILLPKARAVTSEEARKHLKDAHQRVMSVAAVQQHLHASDDIDHIEVGAYLSQLCGSIADSIIGEGQPIAVKVVADNGMIASDDAVSVGLIVTELLINAIKYAFPVTRIGARILVSYKIDGADWKLTVADNGVGKNPLTSETKSGGLGTAIVEALVKQLRATVVTASGANGVTVTVERAATVSQLPLAG
jgi:two-component sensor histidine kinase